MASENLAEYQRLFQRMNFFFWLTGSRITSQRSRNFFVALITNWNVPLTVCNISYYLYMVKYEPLTQMIMAQQVWSLLAESQTVIRFVNRQLHLDEMENLTTWFLGTYSAKYPSEYHDIFQKHQHKCNRLVNMAVLIVMVVFIVPTLLYIILPVLTGSRELPTPSVYKGVRDYDWPIGIYIFMYIYYGAGALIVLFYGLAEESFFIFNVLIFSCRFDTIGEIMALLNYEGERDRVKDKRIIKDCYILHLEVIE